MNDTIWIIVWGVLIAAAFGWLWYAGKSTKIQKKKKKN